MLPHDCGARQLNTWRLNSGSPGSSCKLSESRKRLGLLRYISKSSSGAATEPDSMGSCWGISRGEFRRGRFPSCSESRERDKRKIVFPLSWLCCLFMALLSLRKWKSEKPSGKWKKWDVLHMPKTKKVLAEWWGRTMQTRGIWLCASYSWSICSVGTFPSANQII